MVKKVGLRVSIPFLEAYLFKNKIRISHVQMDHGSSTVVMYFHGIGSETPEGCMLSEIKENDLPKIIGQIKECLTQD